MARSLVHPSPKDFTLDGVLHALSDPERRKIVLNLLKHKGEGMSCATACKTLSPSTVHFHYKILRDAGLILSKKEGVKVINSLRMDEMNKRFPGLLDSILKHE